MNIDRVRQVTANESDDYFKDETIEYYLNKALQNVVSYLIQKERGANKTLRGLDNLRKVKQQTTGVYTTFDDYSKTSIDVGDIKDYTHLQTDDVEVLRELTQQELPLLRWGNLSPNKYEGYYNVTGNKFELYLPDDTQRTIDVYYVDAPTDVNPAGDGFAELPSQLENAVIYGAAGLMIMQESAKEVNSPAKKFLEIYDRELQLNAY